MFGWCCSAVVFFTFFLFVVSQTDINGKVNFDMNITVVSDLSDGLLVGDILDIKVHITPHGPVDEYSLVFVISYPNSLELISPINSSTSVMVIFNGGDTPYRQTTILRDIPYNCNTSDIAVDKLVWCNPIDGVGPWDLEFSFIILQLTKGYDISLAVEVFKYNISCGSDQLACHSSEVGGVGGYTKDSFSTSWNIGGLLPASSGEGRDLTVILVPVLLGSAALLVLVVVAIVVVVVVVKKRKEIKL
eukprot:TRINITY_DN6307_c0_g1_i1.p1 TRINITY_DN6307_c0_g1~~TRINITY_DN6307_c0_g1_i1.p1  ORF type:complete len:246 (-),score=23.35 TRINITY_DN6307_c0_g1_i1:24-761(-)